MIERVTTTLLLLAGRALAAQPSAPSPIAAPLRDLTWGQINFLHTTDTHGWHAGHLQEASYSADWGDYISFAQRMREKAEADGNDLLLIDTGDRVEGNGLYDSSEPKGVYTFDIFKQQHIDILCSGNHELYKQNSSENEYFKSVPNFKGNYLASNIDIRDPSTGDFVPLAPRFKKFETDKQGIRIAAFGFLFDFTGNYNNTIVQPVEETIKEEWFQEAIRDKEIDLFVVIGHVAARSKEYDAIFKAIRKVKWDTPIQFFAGHYHIRDYVKYDSKAFALASGRFMETIGFASIDGLSTKKKDQVAKTPKFTRKYIDNNLFSFFHHTGLNDTTFPTAHGQNVSKQIQTARHALELDTTYGCAPKTFWMSRAKYGSDDSIFTWLADTVLPQAVKNPDRDDKPRLILTNTGAIRFDLFEGAFTRDTTFIVSPFTSGFNYIKDVSYAKAAKIISILNGGGNIMEAQTETTDLAMPPTWMLLPPEQLSPRSAGSVMETLVHGLGNAIPQSPLSPSGSSNTDLIPGYTTSDDLGKDGDDTVHAPINFCRVPNAIQASVLNTTSPSTADKGEEKPETVDLVYVDFIQPWIAVAAKLAGLDFDLKDVENYMPGATLASVMTDWVDKNWGKDC